MDTDEERMDRGGEVRHKKRMVKPERRKDDREQPNYHYRQKSNHMPTFPSATGNDPLLDNRDGEAETNSSRSMDMKSKDGLYGARGNVNKPMERVPSRHRSKKKKRGSRRSSKGAADEQRRLKAIEQTGPPEIWPTYCAVLTFFIPDLSLIHI